MTTCHFWHHLVETCLVVSMNVGLIDLLEITITRVRNRGKVYLFWVILLFVMYYIYVSVRAIPTYKVYRLYNTARCFLYFLALQKFVPLMPPPKINFTATSGDRVVLPCPIQPGALLQQYSVRWKKGNTLIAEATTADDDSQYNIDRANYSLIINSVTINDTNLDYQCELKVTNPVSATVQILQPSSLIPVSLSLKVIGKFCCFGLLN